MVPEKQPLLGHTSGVSYGERYRPLTPEEVQTARQEITWRRTRFCLILMFWAIMAMFLSVITCILANAASCNYNSASGTGVPPVHISFAPLISRINGQVYAL